MNSDDKFHLERPLRIHSLKVPPSFVVLRFNLLMTPWRDTTHQSPTAICRRPFTYRLRSQSLMNNSFISPPLTVILGPLGIDGRMDGWMAVGSRGKQKAKKTLLGDKPY